MSKYAATLIEVIIALVLLSLVAGGLSLGWLRHRHRVTFSRSMQSVQGLLHQAGMLCSTAGQEVHISLQQEGEQLHIVTLPYLNIPDKEKRTKIHKLMQRYTQDQTFSGVHSMEINGQTVHKIVICLYPQQGLASVLADSQELLVPGPTPPSFHLIISATGDGLTFPLDINTLLLRHQTEKAFPDEYIQQTT